MSDTKPEFSLGPVTGGLFLNVWRNEVKTDDGPRTIRNVQIARRYKDDQAGEWKNTSSFRTSDLDTITMLVDQAKKFLAENPIQVPEAPYEPDHEPDESERF